MRCISQTKVPNFQQYHFRYKGLCHHLQNRASASCFHLIIMLRTGIRLFRVGYIANLHGNGCMRVYKNSTVFSKKTAEILRIKVQFMLNSSVKSFYDNLFKESQDTATNGIKVGRFRPPTVYLRPSLANIRTNISPETSLVNIFVSDSIFTRSHIVVSESEAKKIWSNRR